ncbi:MAG: hypothetical protein ACYCVH_15650 [Ignavibacteriaceae bacterium]
MRNKIIYIIAFILLLSGIIYFLKTNRTKQEAKSETTYSTGKTEQLYKKGKDSIITETKNFHSSANLASSAEDSTYNFIKEDSSYKLSINIKPAEDGNLLMDYFLDLTSKELVRIDTIYKLRVDTLKIKKTITERIEPPCYNTFLFGALTTTLVIILIIQLIP